MLYVTITAVPFMGPGPTAPAIIVHVATANSTFLDCPSCLFFFKAYHVLDVVFPVLKAYKPHDPFDGVLIELLLIGKIAHLIWLAKYGPKPLILDLLAWVRVILFGNLLAVPYNFLPSLAMFIA